MIVASILHQHADDAAALADGRQALTSAAPATLARLLRADQRLLANLDGLRLAGADGRQVYQAMREQPSYGSMFVLTVHALEMKDTAGLDELLAIVQAVPGTIKGLLAAFGWIEKAALRRVVGGLLSDRDPFKRFVAVAACGLHRVDPGTAMVAALRDPDGRVRARAFRTAGELGRQDLLQFCASAVRTEGGEEARFWAAWSAVLLGGGAAPLAALRGIAGSASIHQDRAFRLALQGTSQAAAHDMLQGLAAGDGTRRRLIQGSGIAGDPGYVPWLFKQMNDRATARIAAEAFALMAGVDLTSQGLDRPAPADIDSGSSDGPAPSEEDLDSDYDLTWPDPERIQAWWGQNSSRFVKNARHFLGQPVTRARCVEVLKTGCQRQRILAAHYLCLLDPGTPLFNTSAPAWRQQRLLAAL